MSKSQIVCKAACVSRAAISIAAFIGGYRFCLAQDADFDASGFRNPRFVSAIYAGHFRRNLSEDAVNYLSGFTSELDDKNLCVDLIDVSIVVYLSGESAKYVMAGNAGRVMALADQGTADAEILARRYSCQGEVTQRIANNINTVLGGN